MLLIQKVKVHFQLSLLKCSKYFYLLQAILIANWVVAAKYCLVADDL